jgi:hypothetical protein
MVAQKTWPGARKWLFTLGFPQFSRFIGEFVTKAKIVTDKTIPAKYKTSN